jgi:hypothetical protein
MVSLPVISDVQLLELAYALYPSLSKQCLSFSDCPDISLGLIETNGLKAVLSAQSSLFKLEKTIITLRDVKAGVVENGKVILKLEPLQYMNLRFELGKAMIDDMSPTLPEDTPHYSLVQHLIMGRLEHVLTTMDVFYLGINSVTIPETFAKLLKPRSYQYSQRMYGKFLLMTSTVNVLP